MVDNIKAFLTQKGVVRIGEGVVGIAENLLGLPIPIGLQLAALAAGTVSYGAVTAGLAAATVSLAKRSPSELQAGSGGSDRELPGSSEP